MPGRPPKVVYLDMLHWISLAKAQGGHPDGAPYVDSLAACVIAVADGAAVFPISDSIFAEVSRIKQYRQRCDLQQVIEELSRYRVVPPRTAIATHEIEAMLDEVVGQSRRPINAWTYLDWGVARAFGMVGGFRVYDEHNNDVTERARRECDGGPDAFDAKALWAELELNRRCLTGPSENEEPELRELGWQPGWTITVAEQRAKQEIEQAERFNSNPSWRRGRLRDVIAAREVVIEINETLATGLFDRGARWEDVFDSPTTARRCMDAMPSFDVAVSIKTSYHQNPEHRWTSNDIHDIDALGSTVPYCDVVLTDKAVTAHVNRVGLAERLNTVVLARLEDLLPLL